MKSSTLCSRGGFDEDSEHTEEEEMLQVRKTLRSFVRRGKEEGSSRKGGREEKKFSKARSIEEDGGREEKVQKKLLKGKRVREQKESEEEEEDAYTTDDEHWAPKQEDKLKQKVQAKVTQTRNPFAIPPSEMTLNHFRIQHPFVTIIDDSVVFKEREDKVRDDKFMDDAALMAAILAMQHTGGLFNRAFKSPSSEIGGRPYHIALASGFWLITEPHEQPIFSSFEQVQQKPMKDESSSELESQQDLKIALKKVPCSGGESNESLDVRQEGHEGENAEAKVRYDFNFMIYDKTLKGSDTKVSTLIVDATWSNYSMNKMCQVSSYGCKYAIKNMEKGRYAPLYVELWGEDRWRYGILYLKGTVVLEDGKVVATTLNCSSFEDLENTLQNTKKRYKQTIRSFTYPDGSYVEGWLYMPNEKFSLPNTSGSNIEDVQCFYQSKIRIIAGDKALQWKEDDMKKRIATRLSTVTGAEDLARSWKPMADNKRLKLPY